jgi:hypothetical protein
MIVKSLKTAYLRLKHVAVIMAFKTNSCLRRLIIDNILSLFSFFFSWRYNPRRGLYFTAL